MIEILALGVVLLLAYFAGYGMGRWSRRPRRPQGTVIDPVHIGLLFYRKPKTQP